MGGQTSDLVELILRRVNGQGCQPDPLIAELERRDAGDFGDVSGWWLQLWTL